MNRRRLIQFATLSTISLTAGCLGVLSSGPGGDVLIRNEDDTSHQITVELTSGSETEFERQVELNPQDSVEYSDAFDGGRYGVAVEIDGERAGSDELNVGDCSAITLHITVTNDGTVGIRQDHCD